MPDDLRVVVDDAAVDHFMAGPEIKDSIMAGADPAAERAQAGAAKLTGEGAASMHAEAILDGPEWTARISWDRVHYYMFFHERGTKFMDARPFLVPSITTT